VKFTLIVNHADARAGENAWREPLNRPQIKSEAAAREEGARTVANFNDTLRDGERPRVLIGVEFGENDASAKHDWQKTNLTTQHEPGKRGRQFDSYRCEGCGITGKRFTLDGDVIPDPQFKAKAFRSCDTARERLRARAEAQEGDN
jgi:hypothetical protein